VTAKQNGKATGNDVIGTLKQVTGTGTGNIETSNRNRNRERWIAETGNKGTKYI